MAYKRFVKRGGKTFGPYYYESYRDGDQVRKRYIGRLDERKESDRKFISEKNLISFLFLAILIIGFINFFALFYTTGRATLGVVDISATDTAILGKIGFNLKQGELMPADSIVKVKLNNQIKEIPLSSFLGQEKQIGNFYVENEAIQGSGEGYGTLGRKKVYPNVFYRLKLETFERAKEPIYTISENETGGGEEQPTEPVEEIPAETGEPVETSESETSTEPETIPAIEQEPETPAEPGLTGQAIRTDFIDGRVNASEKIVYVLEENQQASIEPGSVRNDTDALADNIVNLAIESGNASVTTDYFLEETGFGQEYLTNDTFNFEINLTEFGLFPEEGLLEIYIVYQDDVLVEASKIIEIMPAEPQVPEENETLPELPAGNETNVTEQNVTNVTEQNVTAVNITTSHEQIRLNARVKWMTNVTMEVPQQVIVQIPAEAENITIKNLAEQSEPAEAENITVNATEPVEQVEPAEQTGKGNLVGLSSEVIVNISITVSETGEKEVVLDENSTDYIIEYYTGAPEASEQATSYGKRVVISGPGNLGYTNILSFAGIPEKFSVGQENMIRIKWVENNSYVPFNARDTDGNGKLDYVEWLTEHLSNQTFDIILITKAEHLDENRTMIEDVYEQVKERDGIFKEIPGTHYLRIVFSEKLTSENDITIYARSNSSAGIEVYEANGSEKIADFGIIGEDNEYKIYLTNLTGEQDMFDLRVAGEENSSVEFDYVVDPSTPGNISACQVLDTSGVYYLNTTVVTTGTCFTVTAPSVTLDCQNWSNKIIYGNKTTGTSYGVYSDQNNTIIKNCRLEKGNLAGAAAQVYGIYLANNLNNTVENTNASNNWYGIYLDASSENKVYTSMISNNTNTGIYLDTDSKRNNITSNNVTNNNQGLTLWSADYSTVISNNISNNAGNGLSVSFSANNTITSNVMQENGNYDMEFAAGASADCPNAIQDNTGSGGKRILYYNYTVTLQNENNISELILCGAHYSVINNVTVSGSDSLNNNYIVMMQTNYSNITNSNSSNNYRGIIVYYGQNNTIQSSTINNNNDAGVYLYYCDWNSITSNTIKGNNYGIYDNHAYNNTVWNNLFNNTINAYDIYNQTKWNITKDCSQPSITGGRCTGGNWWGDYNQTDTDGDGIGNTRIPYNSSQNIAKGGDYLPLVYPSVVSVDSCRLLNITNAYYNVTQALNINGTCFNVTANTITIDGNGKTITYGIRGTNSQYGIYAKGSNFTTIKNVNLVEGNVSGSIKYAVYFLSSKNSTVQNSTISTIGGYGIAFLSSSGTIVSNNITSSNNYGIYVQDNSDYTGIISNNVTTSGANMWAIELYRANFTNIVSNNILTTNTGAHGIYLYTLSYFNNITSNNITVLNSDSYGIYIDSRSNYNNLTSNTIVTKGTGGYGIYASGSLGTDIIANKITTFGTNTGYGIILDSANSSAVQSNNILATGEMAYGVYILNAKNNSLDSNYINTSTVDAYGIYLSKCLNSSFTSNTVIAYTADRIRLSNSENNTFSNNSLVYNKEAYEKYYDIYFMTAGNNGTRLVNQYLENYTFTGAGGKIIVEDTAFGMVSFIRPVNGSGTNLSADIQISNDSAYVNSGQTGLNKSANITLYNLQTDYSFPIILRDGILCNRTTSPACVNLTGLNAGNVIFNVTSWSNYSIDEKNFNISTCQVLDTSNGVYVLTAPVVTTGTCFNVTADNVTLDCGSWSNSIIYGNSTTTREWGVYSKFDNTVVRNCNITVGENASLPDDDRYGIEFYKNGYGTIENSHIGRNRIGVYLEGSQNNTIYNNTIDSAYLYSLALFYSSSWNIVNENTMSYNGQQRNVYIYEGSNHSYIFNNTVLNTASTGIDVITSRNTTLYKNTIINCSTNGVQINRAQKTNVSDNIIKNCSSGIYSSVYTETLNLSLAGNVIEGMTLYGIFSDNTGRADAKYNNITNATYGIYYRSSNNSVITGNYIQDNIYGIYLNKTKNNTIYNNFVNNTNNVVDNGNNTWNITYNCASGTNIIGGACIGGNWWGDYAGEDTDYDGIGDTLLPYNASNNISAGGDWLPLVYLLPGEVIEISECQALSQKNAYYKLTQNVAKDNMCFNITARNTTLDCQGFTITGNQTGYGVYVSSVNNVTIKNCHIYNFSTGAWLAASSSANVTNNTVMNNTAKGIAVVDSSSNTIKSNTIAGSSYGVYLDFGSVNTVTSNIITNNTAGISALYGNSNTLSSNIINSSGTGIIISTSSYNRIANNSLSYNAQDGIFIGNGGTGTNITGNSIFNNSASGISLVESSACVVSLNTVTGNSQKGIYNEGGNNNNFTSNTVKNNSYGIYLNGGANNRVYNNFVNNTGGINAYDSGTNYWNTTLDCGDGTSIIGTNCIGGNFWSDYLGVDTGTDNIGDTLLPYNASNNISAGGDWLPLVSSGITIGACAKLDQANKVYNLNQTVFSNATCFNVTADNVTFDCGTWANKIIYGNSTATTASWGIYSNKSNTVVRNCEIRTGNLAGIPASNRPRYGVYFYKNKNCKVDNVNISLGNPAVLVSNSNYTIINNSLMGINYYYGIWLNYSSGNNITGDNVSRNNALTTSYGLYAISSHNNTIISSIFDDNTHGIYISVSQGNTLLNNKMINNSQNGVTIYSSNSSIFTDNNISNNKKFGILVDGGIGNNVTGNRMQENLVYDFYTGASSNLYCSNTIQNNMGSAGKSILYYNASTILQNNDTLSEIVLCGADYSSINNVKVSGSDILYNNGIVLINTSYTNVTNSNSSNNYYGIALHKGTFNIISSSNINNNSLYGIFSNLSNYNTFDSLTTADHGSYQGIYLYYSNHSFVQNSNTSRNTDGIRIDYGINNTVLSNNANNNKDHGIYLYNSDSNNVTLNTANGTGGGGLDDRGITLESSNNNIVNNNTASNNSDYGIYIDGSHRNNITFNTANSNGVSGIYTTVQPRNNTFLGNTANNNSWYGIDIGCENTALRYNNDVLNNTANGNGLNGILYGGYCTDGEIKWNTANYNAQYGISAMTGSTQISKLNISYNTASHNRINGLFLGDMMNNNTIYSNTFVNNSNAGIYLDYQNNPCQFNNISSNFIYNNTYGIVINYNYRNTILDNVIQENTNWDLLVELDGTGATSSICNNTILNNLGSGGRQIVFYNNTNTPNLQNNDTISELVLCNADNAIVNNVTVRGSDTLNNNGILLVRTNRTLISNSSSLGNYYGLYVYRSPDNNFTNIIINDSRADAIYLFDIVSRGNILKNFTVTNTNSSMYDLRFATSGMQRTQLVDFSVGSYTFTNLGNTTFKDTDEAEIKFLPSAQLTATGTNLSADIRIGNNSVSVNSTAQTGLNKPANITLYNIMTSYASPIILRNNRKCNSSVCYNYTDLNAGTVVFNISYWTNYSISEQYTNTTTESCEVLTEADKTYMLTQTAISTGTCFNVTASNITIDCQNWSNEIIYGNVSSTTAFYGVYSNQNYTSIKNCEIKKGSLAAAANPRYGIAVVGGLYAWIENSNISINRIGILFNASIANTVVKNVAGGNSLFGIYLNRSSNNTIYNNNFNNPGAINVYDNSAEGSAWNSTKNCTSGLNIVGQACIGGNYWQDYTGTDTDDDYIGDTNLPYNSSNNISIGGDWMPLIKGIECGSVLVQNATLKGNLVNCTGNALVVGVRSITINCMGYNITGMGSANGIDVTNYNNITIVNCTISNFERAISLTNSSYDAIALNNFLNSSIGVWLNKSNSSLITWNYIMTNTIGFNITGPSGKNLVYNNFINNTYNAYDNGNNKWNISKTYGSPIIGGIGTYEGGNFWGDYAGEDTDSDGIGDTNLPYTSSSGITTGGDWKPLVSIPVCGNTLNASFYLSSNMDCSGANGLDIGKDNIIINCNQYEISGDNSHVGINVSGFSNVTITNCTIANFSIGVMVDSSQNDTITSNIITGNGVGLNLSSSDFNLVYNNWFNNTNNVYDLAGTNYWNISKTEKANIAGQPYTAGNFWSDYTGTDTDNDGIGNTNLPYNANIASDGDWLPLVDSIRGSIITEDTDIIADITECPYDSSCLEIGSDNIVLDCNGHKIKGKGSGYGILIDPAPLRKTGSQSTYSLAWRNITIQNCRLENFEKGIAVNSRAEVSAHARCSILGFLLGDDKAYSREIEIDNLNLINTTVINASYPVWIKAESDYDYSRKECYPLSDGVDEKQASAYIRNATIIGGNMYNVSGGIFTLGDNKNGTAYVYNASIKNIYFENSTPAIDVKNYTRNAFIFNNTFFNSSNYAVRLSEGLYSNVTSNNFTSNVRAVFIGSLANYSEINFNNFIDTARRDIEVVGFYNTIGGNNFSSWNRVGSENVIWLNGGDYNTIYNNNLTATGYVNNIFSLTGSVQNSIANNTVYHNIFGAAAGSCLAMDSNSQSNYVGNNTFLRTTTTTGIDAQPGTVVDNNYVENEAGTAIGIGQGSSITITNNIVNGSGSSAGTGIGGGGLYDFNIRNNKIYDTLAGTSFVGVSILWTQASTTQVVENNTVYNAHGYGITLGTTGGARTGIKVENNTLVNCSSGILLDGAGSINIRNNNITGGLIGIEITGGTERNYNITNNTVTYTRLYGISIGNTSTQQTHNSTIANNTIRNIQGNCIWSRSGDYQDGKIDFRENVLDNCTASAVFIHLQSYRNFFVNNRISNSTIGVDVSSGRKHSFNGTILQNVTTGFNVVNASGYSFYNTTFNNVTWPFTAANSTNFSIEKTEMPANMMLRNDSAGSMINFTQNMSINSLIDFFNIVKLRTNFTFVNTTANPELNRSAILTITSQIALQTAKILVSLGDDDTYTECTASTDPSCSQISFNSTIAVFNASHFTTYAITEGAQVSPLAINFTGPTPANGSLVTKAEINVSIMSSNGLNEMKFNWNSANYTMYNDSLVLMMNFENLSSLGENSTRVADLSKYLNNGTVNGSTWNSSGKYGGDYEFDGTDDIISVPDNPSLRLPMGNAITISAWINTKKNCTSVNCQTIIGKRGTSSELYGLYLTTNNKINHYFRGTNSSGINGKIGNGIIATDNWYHIVATYNSTTLYSYINGNLDYTYTSALTANSSMSGVLGIGRESSMFNGTIDEVMIFNRSMTADEISQMYKSNLQKYNSTQWYFYSNQTGNTDGAYDYYAWAKDTSSNENQTETRSVTLDSTGPYIAFVSPVNGLSYTSSIVLINITNSSDAVNVWWNNETANLTYTGEIYQNFSEGSHTFLAWANDSMGNINSTSTTFTIDYFPAIEFRDPTPADGTQTVNTSVIINVSIAESNFNDVKFNWNGTNYTYYNSSLVLMMNFENLSSIGENATKVVDLSKSSNNGTVYTAVWDSTGGKYGATYQFDGKNSYIDSGDKPSLEGMPALSVSAWVKTRKNTTYQGVVGKWTSGSGACSSGSYILLLLNDGRVDWTTKHGATDETDVSSTLKIQNNEWYYLTGVFNGTHDLLYVNGVLNGTVDVTDAAICNSTQNVKIGWSDWTSDIKFNGTIDEARIWNRALSASEISQQYYSNLQKYNSSQWYFYSNQSNLSIGTYTYYAWAKDTNNNENKTETRNVTIITNVAPLFSNAVNSSANFTRNTNFTANITIDNDALDAYIFATNASGSWVNTTVDISGVEHNASETAVIGVGRGSSVCWYYWANDTSGLNNQSDTYCFAVNNTAPTQSIPWIGSHNRFARSLVGEWRFENSKATWTYDETGINNGTVIGATLSDEGRVGRGFEFDGDDDYISVTDTDNLEIMNHNMSFVFWIKSINYAGDRILDKYDYGSEKGYMVYLYTSGGNTRINFIVGNGTRVDKNSGYIITDGDNQWHQIGVTFDYSNVSAGIKFYHNGAFVKSDSHTITGGLVNNTNNLKISGTGANSFNGSIDEVRIWNRSLSASEITDLYNTSSGKFAYDNQDIGASANETSDTDNDNVTNVYNWLVNNVSLAVLNMPFDVGSSSTNVKDYALGLNGTTSLYTTSCPTDDGSCAWTTGKIGNALKFDGVNNAIPGPAANTYVHNSSYTLMLWANALNKSVSSTLFLGFGGWDIMTYSGSTGYLAYSITYDSCPALTYTVPNPLSKWVHVAVVVTPEPSAALSNKTLYVNGTAVASACVNISKNNAALRFDICGYSSQTNYAFNGTCDEFRMWNRSLSANEILNIYTNESIGQSDVNMNRTNLKAEYALNQTTGQTAIESSQGLNATLYGYTRPSWTNAGKYGGAYVFTGGAKQVINVPSMATNNLNFSGSVSLWAYATSAKNYATMIEKRSLGGNGIYMQTEYSSQMAFWVDYGPACGKGYGSPSPIMLVTGRWQHYVMTWDNATRNMSVYVNGTLVYNNNSCMIDSSSVGIGNNLQMTIGNRDTSFNTQDWNGTIDEVMIFNRSLSADEIKSLYESGYRNIMKAETNLGETWKACITPNDGSLEADTKCTSEMPIETLSAPTLFRPNAGNVTVFARKPWLEWFNTLDFVNYEVMVSNDSEFTTVLARGSDIASGSGTHSEAWTNLTSYQNSSVALPVDALNYWKVRAYNEGEYGTWTTFEYFTIPSVVSVNFTVNTINFGSLLSTAENDTSSNNPYPFVIQNDGNVLVNGTVTSTYLWTTVSGPSSSYQYKFRVNETGAFNEALSTMNWENCADTASELANLAELLYEINQRAVFMDIRIAPPSDEPAGAKNSTVTLNIEIAE